MTAVLERLRPARTSLWRNRDFNLLWGSQCLSELGSSMSSLAYPLLVLALTGSPVLAGSVGTVAMVTRTAARIPAGVLVDRVNRRRLMLVCDAVRLTAFVTLGAAVLTGWASLPLILAVAVVESLGTATFTAGELSAVPNLVPKSQVPVATARNEAKQYGIGLAGPPLGGALFGLGRALPFLGDAVSYLLSFVGLSMIRTPFQAERARPAGSPLRDLVEGVRFLLAEPFLRAAVFIALPLNFATNGLMFGIVLVLQRRGTAPALIGTVETIVGAGGLCGAFLAGLLIRRFRYPVLIRAILLLGLPLLLAIVPLTASPAAAVPIALLLLLSPALNAGLFGYQAAVTPDRLQGRVVSALFTAATGMAALSPLAAGLMLDHTGPTGMVLLFVASYAVAALVSLLSKGIRTMRPIADG
jgi:MFS family permease